MDIAGGLAGGTMMTVASQTLLAATGQTMSDSPSVLIIGAGPSGIAMAHELKHKLAFQDFTIYEKLHEVGGTWVTGPYPGCVCDFPTHLSSFSFNLNPNWSKELCEREEVAEYLNATVDKFKLRPHIHTSVEVVRAQWLEKTNMWSVCLKDLKTDVEFIRYATILISAVGGSNFEPNVELEGMDRFQGDLFPIAEWPTTWGKDSMAGVKGKRVAVVGNGSSTTHLIPNLVKDAVYVKQFARSAQWHHGRPNQPIGSLRQAMYRYLPLYQRLHRLRLFLESESESLFTSCMSGASAAKAHAKLEDRTRESILANAPSKYHDMLITGGLAGSERQILDSDYLEALHAENLDVSLEEIREITDHGITCVNGTHDEFDVVVLAPGPQETQFPVPIEIIGSHDSVSLKQYWTETRGAQAYFGSLVYGFPNLGIISGPNTVPAHGLALFASEVSIEYLSRVLIAPILDNRATTVTVRQAVEDRFNQILQMKLRKAAVETGRSDIHVNQYGRNVVNWPGLATNYWLQTWLKGGEGVVYKGGGGAWWINYLVRYVRSVRNRTWLTLLLILISLRLRAVRAKVDRELGRYKPIERQVEGYLSPLKPLRDEVSKMIFKA